MSRRPGILLVLGLFVAIAGAFAVPAAACSCGTVESLEAAFQRSSAVFTGRVLKIDERSYRKQGGPVQTAKRVRLQILDRWKGAEDDEIIVYSQSVEASCGYPFDASEVHLVFAAPGGSEETKGLWVNLCGRSKPMSPDRHAFERRELSTDLDALDVMTGKTSGPPTAVKAKSCATCSLTNDPKAGLWLILALVALWPLRRTNSL